MAKLELLDLSYRELEAFAKSNKELTIVCEKFSSWKIREEDQYPSSTETFQWLYGNELVCFICETQNIKGLKGKGAISFDFLDGRRGVVSAVEYGGKLQACVVMEQKGFQESASKYRQGGEYYNQLEDDSIYNNIPEEVKDLIDPNRHIKSASEELKNEFRNIKESLKELPKKVGNVCKEIKTAYKNTREK